LEMERDRQSAAPRRRLYVTHTIGPAALRIARWWKETRLSRQSRAGFPAWIALRIAAPARPSHCNIAFEFAFARETQAAERVRPQRKTLAGFPTGGSYLPVDVSVEP